MVYVHSERFQVANTLGLAVITKNEERNIERCLRSVSFATEVVVVDSLSTDETVAIARRLGARVIERAWPGYAKQKQFALEQLTTDWILCLDADEWLEAECANEIRELLNLRPSVNAFRIPRFHFFFGRVLRFGKGVDHPLRLLRRGKGHYSSRAIHEEILVDGEVGCLQFGMIHHSSETIGQRLAKIHRDTDAEIQYDSGSPLSLRAMLIDPIRYFASYVLKRGGWRDGWRGLLLTALFSYQLMLQQLKYRAARRGKLG